MGILADTNVIINVLKNRNTLEEQLIRENNVHICGVVKAEVLHGALSKKDSERLEMYIRNFPSVELVEEDWVPVGKFLCKLRLQGFNVSFQDALIAYLAMKHDMPVWTDDKHFRNMKKVLPELKLFNPLVMDVDEEEN